MSLVKAWWLIIGGAGVLAVSAPLKLVQAEHDAALPLLADPELGPLVLKPVGSLDRAYTRPAFTPDRAPPGAIDPTKAMAASAAPPPPPQQLPKLVGLIGGRGHVGLALVKTANGTTRTMRPGESVDGWHLIGLGADNAQFKSGNQMTRVYFDRSNRLGSASTTAPSQAPIPLPPPQQQTVQDTGIASPTDETGLHP